VATSLKEKRRLVRRIDKLLREQYGEPSRRAREDPLDVLVRTILSQNTSDVNSHRAFDTLKRRFPDWSAAMRAPARKIEQAIRIGGLARVKARRIKTILSQIHSGHGDLSLRPLRAMDVEQAAQALLAFSGVGPKTANCVLLFGCEMNAFPVDTHILRISKRLGLIPEKTTPERAHTLWPEFLPDGLAYSLHLNLIAHGRQKCRARNPMCPGCCLKSLCRSFDRLSRADSTQERA